jgi:titin
VDIVAGATANTIGGTTAAARNVISGNTYNGVVIAFSGTSNNVVEGNFIGTNAGGGALPNGADGVDIIGGATSNEIGGTTPGTRNVISGNAFDGVALESTGTTNNAVQGNDIGTDPSGEHAEGNGRNGVTIDAGASANVVGGGDGSARNVIAANACFGVWITGAGTAGNIVDYDSIGTDALGSTPLGNHADGARVDAGATGSFIDFDVIEDSGGNGVVISGAGTTGNQAAYDLIASNAGDGVLVASASGNLIGGCTVDANAAWGILIDGCTAVVNGNTTSGNGLGGIQFV